uniref:Ion_trans domain-containing protein n=1 Tax=Enterobius vermicularis TaxID=51028 RepID=A0A0N4VBH7_ENTVE
LQLLHQIYSNRQSLYRIFPAPFRPVAWRTVAFIALIQYIFSIVLPHDELYIQNSSGERVWKKLNGFVSYILLLLLYILGAALRFYRGSIIYEQWAEVLSLLNLLSFATVLLLYTRAHLAENLNG